MTVKVPHPDTKELVDADEVEVVKVDEPFMRVDLADGTKISVRNTIARVVRLKNQWSKDGSPIYTITFNATVNVDPNPTLWKRQKLDA